MEKVNLTAFRARITFFLENLPVAITQHGKVVAEVHPPNHSPSQTAAPPPDVPPDDTKEQKIEALRALIAPIENRVDKSTGEIVALGERRVYREWVEQFGEEITFEGTAEDFIRKYGKMKAPSYWKSSQKV